MFRIEQVFINKRQLLYVQHMVFTVRLQWLAANTIHSDRVSS